MPDGIILKSARAFCVVPSYGLAAEIAAYLNTIWHAEGGNGNAPDLERMAKDSRNNVRDCLMRLEVELMAL
jgi:hypothetical protein